MRIAYGYNMEREQIKELVDRAKLGDQKAFTLLYNYFYPILFRLIKNIIKDQEESEDLTIEAITKAFKKINKYEKDISFELWIKRVTNNYIIDKIRSGVLNNKNISLDEESNKDIVYTDFSNPEKDLIRNETRSLLEEELDLFDGRAKQVVELRYRQDMKYKEIADTLGLSIGTIKKILNKVKKRVLNNY